MTSHRTAEFRRIVAEQSAGQLLDCDTLGDFGGTRTSRPSAVVIADSEFQATTILKTAHELDLDVRLRGAGHSLDGQTLGDEIVMINRASEAQIAFLDRDGERVSVSGRTLWSDLERALNVAGRTAPVLTDYLDLTVGGTLSVGGYGVRSIVSGSQMDHVERIRLIDYSGHARWVDRKDPMFGQALGSLGRGGLIEGVEMRTAPRPDVIELHRYIYRDLEHLLDTLDSLEAAPADQFSAELTGTRVVSEYGYFNGAAGRPGPAGAVRASAVTITDDALRTHVQRCRWLDRFESWRKVWTDVCLPLAQFPAFARRVERLVGGREFRCLAKRYVAVTRSSPRLGTLAPTDGTTGMQVGMGIYFMVPADNVSALEDSRLAARKCLDACLDLGGQPYLYGYCPTTHGTDRQEYRHGKRARDGSSVDAFPGARYPAQPSGE